MMAFVRELRKTGLVLMCFFSVLLTVNGCGAPKKSAEPAKKARGINTVMVMPVKDMTAVYGAETGVRSPLSGKIFSSCPVDPEAPLMLTREMIAWLKANRDYELVSRSQAEGVSPQVLSEDGRAISELALLTETGRRVGVDAVLAGFVYCFRERQGGSLSVTQPASVGFDMFLIRSVDGRVLWSGQYEETQKPLTENLFNMSDFIQRGGRWVTARQLAVPGLHKAMTNFPERRP